MLSFFATCKLCGETSEVSCDGDNPLYCPECLGIDCLEEYEEGQENSA